MSKLFRVSFVVCALLAGFAGTAKAGILNSIVADGRIHGLQDTSADVGVRLGGGGAFAVHSGALAVGDYLAAGIGFDTLERLGLADAPQVGSGGFSVLKIGSLVPIPASPLSTFTFVAPTVVEWNKIVDDVFGGAAALKKTGAGTLLNLYENAATDFDRISPIVPGPNSLIGSAATLFTGGAKIAELGFTGAANGSGNITANLAGEGWIASGPNTPGTGSSFPLNAGIVGSSFALGINRLSGFGGFNFLPLLSSVAPGFVDFVGSGTLSGYGDGSGNPVGPWQIGDDADLSFRPVAIPEPTSMLIFGGLATGFVTIRRRRSNATC